MRWELEEAGTALVRSLMRMTYREGEGSFKEWSDQENFGVQGFGDGGDLSMIAGASKGGEIADSGKRWKKCNPEQMIERQEKQINSEAGRKGVEMTVGSGMRVFLSGKFQNPKPDGA